ncbi:MAG: carboxypeptidase-like regulatory domain-containing protein [Planctomycetes bacterium]|nr:carboxypeptidase-like regulatory domain-containing protein [Planctomycetota bacterium]
MRLAVWLVALVLLAGLAGWLVLDRDVQTASSVASSSPTSSEPPTPSMSSAGAKSAAAEPPSNPTSRAQVSTRVRAHVTDPDGKPLVGAEVSLVPFDDAAAIGDCGMDAFERVERITRRVSTDANGDAEFELDGRTAEAGGRQILWATHPPFEARFAIVQPSTAATLVELALSSTARCRVFVGDLGGPRPVEVRIVGFVAPGHELSLGTDATVAQRAFARTLRITSESWSDSIASRATVLACVQSDGLRSNTIRTTLTGDVRLEASPCFSVSGVVLAAPGIDLSRATRISIGPVDEYAIRWSTSLAVRADGSFGPIECPWEDVAEFGFGLSSDVVLAEFQKRATPRVGEHVQLTFEPRAGAELAVRVTDDHGSPVSGAAVLSFWAPDTPFYACQSARILTDEQGISRVPIPAAAFMLGVTRRGFVPAWRGPLDFAGEGPRALDVALEPGGRIVGRVLADSKPVTDFTVQHWPGDRPERGGEAVFKGRSDGRFEIEDVEISTLQAFASSSTRPRSEIVAASFVDGVADVGDLELPRSLQGRGRVIESESRQPLAGASVGAWNAWGLQLIAPQGDPVITGADGTFEIDGLRDGLNLLWVQAPEHHFAQPSARPSADGIVEFGDIALERDVEVAFQLESSRPLDYSEFALEGRMQVIYPQRAFPSDGRLVVPNCGRGSLQFVLTYPDESTLYHRLDLPTAVPITFVHRVPNDATLSVTARLGDLDVTSDLSLWIHYRDGGGEPWERKVVIDADTSTRVEHLPAGLVVLRLYVGGDEVARKRVELTRGTEASVELRPSERLKTLVLRNADDTPRAGASVAMACTADSPRSLEWRVTDAEGRLTLPMSDCHDWLLSVVGPSSRLALRVLLDDRPTQTILLEPGAELALRLLDGSTPLAGITMWVSDVETDQVLEPLTTGADGTARWQDIGTASYRVHVGGQGLWAVEHTVGAMAAPATERALEVRRTGGVEFDVRGTLGEAVLGAELVLEHAELGEDLAAWTAEGRLVAPANGWRSDATGRLRIAGIPRGEYRWSFALADGRSASGTVEIPPAGTASVQATLE